jgi:hypothetical protein
LLDKATADYEGYRRCELLLEYHGYEGRAESVYHPGHGESDEQITNKMWKYNMFPVEAFSDVLGAEKAEEFEEKRKAVDDDENQKKEKGRLEMKNGKFETVYE